MSIADNTLLQAADTSDLRHMFGMMCIYIFDRREAVLKNSQSISSDNYMSDDDGVMNATNLVANGLGYDPSNDFRLLHKTLCMYIKSGLDSEKISSFQRNTKEMIYAMTAMADEIFLNIEWRGKAFWELNMLELKFFGTQIAGEEVYRKINELLEEGNVLSIEKAEIYVKMLSMGFMGRFREQDGGESDIQGYRYKLFDFISKRDSAIAETIEHRMFQKEYAHTMPTVNRKLLPDASSVTYFLFLFLFMFLVITTCVWFLKIKDINNLLFEISHIALRG